MSAKQHMNERTAKLQIKTWEDLQKVSPEYWHAKVNDLVGGAKLITEKEHGTFLRDIHTLADKIGMKRRPSIMLVNNFPGIPMALRKLPNAAALPLANIIMINPPALEFCKSSIYRPPNKELKAMVAHELSHMKYDVKSSMFNNLGPAIAPLAGMAALWLYEQSTKKNKNHNNTPSGAQSLTKEIHKLAQKEEQRIDEQQHEAETWHPDPAWQKTALTIGKYTAVAVISYIAAMYAAKPISLRAEYNADRRAVELLGEPEIVKKMLVDFHQMRDEVWKKIPEPKTLMEKIRRGFIELQAETNHAHPSLTQRIEAIDSYVAKVEKEKAAKAAWEAGLAT